MKHFLQLTKKQRITTSLMSLLLCISSFSTSAEVTEDFVVIHCESPGSLTLSEESLIAPNLKVTGTIDARDFRTLKEVTMCTTRELDLSEAVIAAYTGTDGCASSPGGGGWMIRSDGGVDYPANTFPVGAFTEWRNNSLYDFCEGTETLARLILPATLEGFMEGSFISKSILTDLEVPASSTTIRNEGHAVYSYDGSTLLAVAPAWYGNLIVPATVTSIAPTAFEAASPASVTFTSPQMPLFPEEAKLNTLYIIAPDPAPYQEKFPEIDCLSELTPITVTVAEPGMLMTEIGNKGFSRNQVKALTVSGTLSYDDFEALVGLPSLHFADLSEATVQNEDWQRVVISNPALTELKFPKFSHPINLRIEAEARLHGHIDVPYNTYSFNSYSPRFSSATFPAYYQTSADRLFPYYSVVEWLDFSQCAELDELTGYAYMGRLSSVKLPENLKKIINFYGPVKEMNLPVSLECIYGGRWLIDKLTLHEALTEFTVYSLPMVKEIDASKASSLATFRGLDHAPNLKRLDLSLCPIEHITSLFGGVSTGSLVVSGGSAYKAVSVKAIESVALPSTLKSLNGFTDCPALKALDLMQCFRLESLYGLNNCPALEYVTLPESLKSINGFINTSALTSIKCAAPTAPTYTYGYLDESDKSLVFSNISLLVGEGTAGSYRMSEGWEQCKNISDAAYCLSISLDNLEDVTENLRSLNLYGAGLYAPEEEAELNGLPYGSFLVKGWKAGEETIESNPGKVKVTSSLTVAPLYTLDYEKCDLVMTVSATEPAVVPLWLGFYSRAIYVDGKKVDEFSDTHWRERTTKIGLDAGTHLIAVASPLFSVNFEEGNEYDPEESPTFKVTDFHLNNPGALASLTTFNFDMDLLDLSGCDTLLDVTTKGYNRILKVDLSDCTRLYRVFLENTSLEEFIIPGANLTSLALPGNLLTEIDLSGYPHLENLNLASNRLKSLDISPCHDLLYLTMYDNELTEFKYADHPLLEMLYLYDNNLSHFHAEDFPALSYYGCSSQEFEMAISEADFDISLIDADGFDPSRISEWWIEGYMGTDYLIRVDAEVEGNKVIIPEEFGSNLWLKYNYLTNPSSGFTTEHSINLTREGFGSVGDLMAEGIFSIDGNMVIFADGITGEVYTPGGVSIFKGNGQSPALPSGVYIVRIGSSVKKIAIP